jgi:HTH-type transcriptional regulator/antitoxin HigA
MTPLANPAQMIKMIEKGAPRVIHTEEELDQYAKALFRLTAKDNPTPSELQAVELLTMLVEQYEDRIHPIPSASPVDVLRYLMDRHDLKQKDLVPELGSESNVSQILSGARNLTLPHIYALAARFSVPASAFVTSGQTGSLRST